MKAPTSRLDPLSHTVYKFEIYVAMSERREPPVALQRSLDGFHFFLSQILMMTRTVSSGNGRRGGGTRRCQNECHLTKNVVAVCDCVGMCVCEGDHWVIHVIYGLVWLRFFSPPFRF